MVTFVRVLVLILCHKSHVFVTIFSLHVESAPF